MNTSAMSCDLQSYYTYRIHMYSWSDIASELLENLGRISSVCIKISLGGKIFHYTIACYPSIQNYVCESIWLFLHYLKTFLRHCYNSEVDAWYFLYIRTNEATPKINKLFQLTSNDFFCYKYVCRSLRNYKS